MSAAPDLFPPSLTVDEARLEVLAAARTDEGGVCPCCSKLVKVYRRNLTAITARALIWLYRAGGEVKFVHFNDKAPRELVKSGGYFALARHWGLIEQAEPGTTPKGKRSSGYWKLTAVGAEFIRHRRAVPAWVDVLNNQVVGVADERVNISMALGREFNYRELMGLRETERIPQYALPL